MNNRKCSLRSVSQSKIVAKEKKSDVIVCDQDFKNMKYFAGNVSYVEGFNGYNSRDP